MLPNLFISFKSLPYREPLNVYFLKDNIYWDVIIIFPRQMQNHRYFLSSTISHQYVLSPIIKIPVLSNIHIIAHMPTHTHKTMVQAHKTYSLRTTIEHHHHHQHSCKK